MNKKVKEAIIAHAESTYPNECCGVVVLFKGREKYVPCTNIDEHPHINFTISPDDLIVAEDVGEIVAYVHSHNSQDELPSEADKIGQADSGVRWIIYSTQTQRFHEWDGGQTPSLYGRQYLHAVTDCYSFVRDFYAQELSIVLTNYIRKDHWWDRGENLYMDNYGQEGFRKIPLSEVRYGDLLVMSIGSTVANHGAIYLGNNKVGHHLTDRLSSIDVYGNFLRDRTVLCLRHSEMDERYAKNN